MSDAMGYGLCVNVAKTEDITAYTSRRDHRGLYTPIRAKNLGLEGPPSSLNLTPSL